MLQPLADVFTFIVGFMPTLVVLILVSIFVPIPLWGAFLASVAVGVVSLLLLRD